MSWSPKQNSSYYLYLCLELFVFLFLLFKSKHLIITMASPSSCHDLHLLHHLECATYLMITWLTRLALRVSSIHQNQTRAFNLPIFGNWWQPFHKDMNWNSIESMLLAQAYLLCVKRYGQVSWTPYGSDCSPYICAKSLDCSLHICLNRKYMRQCLPNDAKV